MKKFSRCVLIVIAVIIISGVGGYFYFSKNIQPVYESTAELYVVPGVENEASIRSKNGGLNNDFTIIFKSNIVISDVQTKLKTTEDISKYISVSSPDNSNIVRITCYNADADTAKLYVDSVASTALKTTTIIPVKSIQIIHLGEKSNTPIRRDLYKNVIYLAGACAGACIVLELLILLFMSAFKRKKDNSDDELEYEKAYGKYSHYNRHVVPTGYIEAENVDLGPEGASKEDDELKEKPSNTDSKNDDSVEKKKEMDSHPEEKDEEIVLENDNSKFDFDEQDFDLLEQDYDDSFEKPLAETIARPVEQTIQKPSAEAITRPVEQTIQKPSAEAIARPVEQTIQKPSAEAIARPVEQTIQKPSEEAIARPVEQTIQKPSEEAIARPVEQTIQKPLAETIAKPLEEKSNDIVIDDSPEDIVLDNAAATSIDDDLTVKILATIRK